MFTYFLIGDVNSKKYYLNYLITYNNLSYHNKFDLKLFLFCSILKILRSLKLQKFDHNFVKRKFRIRLVNFYGFFLLSLKFYKFTQNKNFV